MTNTEKKLTKKDKFAMLAEIPEVAENPMLSEFIAHEIDLLVKKNAAKSSKPTARQSENADIAERVVNALRECEDENGMTVSALLKAVPDLPEDMSLPRMTRIVTDLVNADKVSREVIKRVAYFKAI